MTPKRRFLFALAFALYGCSSEDSAPSGATPNAGSDELVGTCPAGFTPAAGENVGFSSDGADRTFHVMPPSDAATPRPLFVSLTGTVQPELDFAAQSALDQLPQSGWIVAAPVRNCSQRGTTCATGGNEGSKDGRIWEPWFDGTIPASDEEGPDVRFVDAMVRCIATKWPVDAKRIYVGGISAGGSFTNRILTFNSELFAGGVPSSGNWYGGSAAPVSAVTLDPTLVIVIWGGPTDVWPANAPIANYDPETKQAAAYYGAQANTVTVSCTGSHGHIWPTAMTPWLAQTLLSHPKGTPAAAFKLTQPPSGFSCVVGAYTDH
jgi:hypothetical protein